jgi:phosphatidylglycerophosphatase A
LRRISRLLASGFGIGFSPFAPGTVGTVATIPIAALLASTLSARPLLHGLILVLFVVVAVVAADFAARDAEIADPSFVVIDEIVGYLVAVAFLPFTPLVAVSAFCLFRFFDILKPPPLAQLERLPGGIGIVADDVAAGLASHVLLRLATALGWL